MIASIQCFILLIGALFAYLRIESIFSQTTKIFQQLDMMTSRRYLSQHDFLNGVVNEKLIIPRIDYSAPKSISPKIAYCFYETITQDEEIKDLCSEIH